MKTDLWIQNLLSLMFFVCVCVCVSGGIKTGFLSCLGTHSVDQVDLNLRSLPTSASRVLGLACASPSLRCSCLRGYSVSYSSIAEKRPYLNVTAGDML